MYENANAETAKSHATNENALGVVPTKDSTTIQTIIIMSIINIITHIRMVLILVLIRIHKMRLTLIRMKVLIRLRIIIRMILAIVHIMIRIMIRMQTLMLIQMLVVVR